MIAPLGLVNPKANLALWLLSRLGPKIERFITDPNGTLTRLGDLLVWNGPNGQEVLAGLESVAESQERIEGVVHQIEAVEIGATTSLGTLFHVSMFTLGISSLTAGFMLWRLGCLQKRLSKIASQLDDIQAHVQAMPKANLSTGLRFLTAYEMGDKHRDRELFSALENSRQAAGVYADLVRGEATGRRRLSLLNHGGRCYLLALATEIRCLIRSEKLAEAELRLRDEKAMMKALAQATFDEVIGKNPEIYLDPDLGANNVTLEVMTEVYQQAQLAGAIEAPHVHSAAQMFEYFRERLYGARKGLLRWFPMKGHARERALTNLKYLMACLEEVNRMEGLRLRIHEVQEGRCPATCLEDPLAPWRNESQGKENGDLSVVAFSFA